MTIPETSETTFGIQAGSTLLDRWPPPSSNDDELNLRDDLKFDLSRQHLVNQRDIETATIGKPISNRGFEVNPSDRFSTVELGTLFHEVVIPRSAHSHTSTWDLGLEEQLSPYDAFSEPSNIQTLYVYIHSFYNLIPRGTEFASMSDSAVPATEFVKADHDELPNALNDLDGVSVEANEEGFDMPSEVAFSNASRLLKKMYRILPRRFEVYPTPDGEIAIDAPDGHGSSVLLLCDSSGDALCLVNLNGSHRRKRYASDDDWADDFLQKALESLHPANN